jgi:hypothetical protein
MVLSDLVPLVRLDQPAYLEDLSLEVSPSLHILVDGPGLHPENGPSLALFDSFSFCPVDSDEDFLMEVSGQHIEIGLGDFRLGPKPRGGE